MDIILNRVAIWRACGATKLNKRLTPRGTRFLKNSDPVYKTSDTPLIRYCKDYSIGKLKFSLFVRTDNEDGEKIEAALDACAKGITKEQALGYISNCVDMNFVYLDFYVEEGK